MLLSITRGAPAGLLAGGLFWLLSGPLAARMSLGEPEPLDPRGSAALLEAYEQLRSFKVRLFFWMGLSGTVMFTTVAVAVATNPQVGGLMGAVCGIGFGIVGGIFGVIGGVRRARVIELRNRLTAVPDGSRGCQHPTQRHEERPEPRIR